jgi:outer membrane protein
MRSRSSNSVLVVYCSSTNGFMMIKRFIGKNIMLKSSIVKASMIALLLALSGTAHAELKIGVYDSKVILDNLPMVQDEQKKLSAEFAPTQKQISDKREVLLALQESISKNRDVLSEAELRQQSLDFQSKRRDLQLLIEDTDRLFNARRNEVMRAIQNTVEQEVSTFAKDEGYDLILRSGVLHASPKVDITQKVLERLSNR